ncbi:hypothetical protein GE21DRAFT_1307145 [Neurospora crassa]|nr:hypothetical protein GE21DRAFT_1307145 [Neurospora crassa]
MASRMTGTQHDSPGKHVVGSCGRLHHCLDPAGPTSELATREAGNFHRPPQGLNERSAVRQCGVECRKRRDMMATWYGVQH